MTVSPQEKTERLQEIELLSRLHDSLPVARLHDLPAIDWQQAGVTESLIPCPVAPASPPQGRPANAALPRAEAVVITWTAAEWAALDQVFCGYETPLSPEEAKEGRWRAAWSCYGREYYRIHQEMVNVKNSGQGGAPSLHDQGWGWFRLVKIGKLMVLLIKSSMHLAQDGTGLPLVQFVRQICADSQPRLLLSIGTAGGVRDQDALGSALIANQAVFYLLKDFANADFNGRLIQSSWTPRTAFIHPAQDLALQIPGFAVLPVSPQYPPGSKIEPDQPDSRIKVVLDSPVITTDGFLFGTTSRRHGLSPKLGCIVEMDDAVVGMACQEQKVPFGFIRNVSDPVLNGLLPFEIQKAWAAYIYQELGLYTSFNGALAAWAVLAGEAEND